MLVHLALITELLAVMIGVHCLHNVAPKSLVKTIGYILIILLVLEIVNYYQLNRLFTCLGYGVVFVYCKREFGNTYKKTLNMLIVFLILFSTIQFICRVLVDVCISSTPMIQNVIGNLVVLIVFWKVVPKFNIDVFPKCVKSKKTLSRPLLGYMFFVTLVLLLQMKLFHGIQVGIFIFVVPAILLLILLMINWYKTQLIAESLEREIQIVNDTKTTYNELLTKVRLRQHDFKNILAAVFSSHYTCKTYEQLVKVQAQYCEKMIEDNKYNNLLLLGEPVVTAFLYKKFQEAAEDDIKVEYTIATIIENCEIETYYLIEMLGILLDNAVEALKDSENKEIHFRVDCTKQGYEFIIRNRHAYVRFSEIEDWFTIGKTKKGADRGLGLYHLRCLCEELGCSITCQNVEIEDNWIQFILKINKAENT